MTNLKQLEQEESLVHENGGLDVEQADESKSATLTENDDETDWRSIYCTSLLAFFVAIQFALFYSSLWPYLQIIDKDTSESFFGYIIGIYSFGQIIGSPLVGFWSNRIKQISLPLYTNIGLMVLGNFIYILVELAPNNHRYWLLLSRFITGFGSSNISLLKAYTASSSNTIDRSRSIAFVTGGIAVGMFLGPAFQLFFIPLGYPGIELIFGLHLNMYNSPAFVAILLNLICVLAIKFFFREHYAGLVKSSETGMKIKLPPYDKLAIGICYFSRFTQILTNTTLETLSAPLTMALFAWSRHDVVENIALAQLIMSLIAFLTYLLFIIVKADRFLNFRLCCITSMAGLIIFYLLTLSWPFIPGNVKLYHHLNDSSVDEQLGCDADKFTWCYSLRPVNVVLFYVSYVLIVGFSFANINISLNTLFSRIIGPRMQGTQQGLLQVSGGVARMCGPVIMSILYVLYGPRIVWICIILVIVLNLSLWVGFYNRMVPLKVPEVYSTLDQLSADDQSKQKFIEKRASG